MQDKMLTLLSKRMRQQLALACSGNERWCSRASSSSSAVLQKPHPAGGTQHPRQNLGLFLDESCVYKYMDAQKFRQQNSGNRQEKPFDYHHVVYTQSCLACLGLFCRCLGSFQWIASCITILHEAICAQVGVEWIRIQAGMSVWSKPAI